MKWWSFGRFVIVRKESGWGVRSEDNPDEVIVCGAVSEALSHVSAYVQFEKPLENKGQKKAI